MVAFNLSILGEFTADNAEAYKDIIDGNSKSLESYDRSLLSGSILSSYEASDGEVSLDSYNIVERQVGKYVRNLQQMNNDVIERLETNINQHSLELKSLEKEAAASKQSLTKVLGAQAKVNAESAQDYEDITVSLHKLAAEIYSLRKTEFDSRCASIDESLKDTKEAMDKFYARITNNEKVLDPNGPLISEANLVLRQLFAIYDDPGENPNYDKDWKSAIEGFNTFLQDHPEYSSFAKTLEQYVPQVFTSVIRNGQTEDLPPKLVLENMQKSIVAKISALVSQDIEDAKTQLTGLANMEEYFSEQLREIENQGHDNISTPAILAKLSEEKFLKAEYDEMESSTAKDDLQIQRSDIESSLQRATKAIATLSTELDQDKSTLTQAKVLQVLLAQYKTLEIESAAEILQQKDYSKYLRTISADSLLLNKLLTSIDRADLSKEGKELLDLHEILAQRGQLIVKANTNYTAREAIEIHQTQARTALQNIAMGYQATLVGISKLLSNTDSLDEATQRVYEANLSALNSLRATMAPIASEYSQVLEKVNERYGVLSQEAEEIAASLSSLDNKLDHGILQDINIDENPDTAHFRLHQNVLTDLLNELHAIVAENAQNANPALSAVRKMSTESEEGDVFSSDSEEGDLAEEYILSDTDDEEGDQLSLNQTIEISFADELSALNDTNLPVSWTATITNIVSSRADQVTATKIVQAAVIAAEEVFSNALIHADSIGLVDPAAVETAIADIVFEYQTPIKHASAAKMAVEGASFAPAWPALNFAEDDEELRGGAFDDEVVFGTPVAHSTPEKPQFVKGHHRTSTVGQSAELLNIMKAADVPVIHTEKSVVASKETLLANHSVVTLPAAVVAKPEQSAPVEADALVATVVAAPVAQKAAYVQLPQAQVAQVSQATVAKVGTAVLAPAPVVAAPVAQAPAAVAPAVPVAPAPVAPGPVVAAPVVAALAPVAVAPAAQAPAAVASAVPAPVVVALAPLAAAGGIVAHIVHHPVALLVAKVEPLAAVTEGIVPADGDNPILAAQKLLELIDKSESSDDGYEEVYKPEEDGNTTPAPHPGPLSYGRKGSEVNDSGYDVSMYITDRSSTPTASDHTLAWKRGSNDSGVSITPLDFSTRLNSMSAEDFVEEVTKTDSSDAVQSLSELPFRNKELGQQVLADHQDALARESEMLDMTRSLGHDPLSPFLAAFRRQLGLSNYFVAVQ